jgi:amino acid transporter
MDGSTLVTADAMAFAFNSSIMTKVLIVGGMAGIITSWNSFMIGGSRAMFSMAESNMIPKVFGKLHEKYKTPIFSIALIGALSVIAPFFGRKMLVWIVDAGSFGVCLAYAMVSLSFLILRKKEPNMARPYICRNNGTATFWSNDTFICCTTAICFDSFSQRRVDYGWRLGDSGHNFLRL